MRVLIIVIIGLVLSCSERKNTQNKGLEKTKIDSISGLNNIRQFVKSIDSNLSSFNCITPKFYRQDLYSNSGVRHRLDSMFSNFMFLKEDFDNNGYTDLIVTGERYAYNFEVLAIMNFGSQHYSVVPLTLSDIHDFPIYPKLIYRNELPLVELYSHANFAENPENGISKKTLVFKYGQFIDYNIPLENYTITQIEYNASACLGTCPAFELVLNPYTPSLFRAKYYNFSKDKAIAQLGEEGRFRTIIDPEKYDELCDIINDLQIKKLSDFYWLGGTDRPSCLLKIHFSDGTIKTIDDYGKSGTNGLRLLYEKLADLRYNQDWKKI